MDKPDIGLQEYKYSLCARKCGISMSETHLFPSARCEGYFGTKRFDRVKTSEGEKRIHMVSVSALLETSHRIPNLDYIILGKLTLTLTKDYQELEKLFRLMCFNVLRITATIILKTFRLYIRMMRKMAFIACL